jgi:hypothetical protein
MSRRCLTSLSPDQILAIRNAKGINQKDFWLRFGVTPSGGSRYEAGRNIPVQTSILIWLHGAGRLTDEDLAAATKAVRSQASCLA